MLASMSDKELKRLPETSEILLINKLLNEIFHRMRNRFCPHPLF